MERKVMFSPLLFLALAQLASLTSGSSLVILNETFATVSLPAGWTKSQIDGFGWRFATYDQLSSDFYEIPVPPTGAASIIAASNDDACNCTASQDYLTTPELAIPVGFDAVVLTFYEYYTAEWSQRAHLQISVNGSAFVTIMNFTGSFIWQRITIDLKPYEGYNINIRFWANDNGAWASGWAIEEVQVIAYNLTGLAPQCARWLFPSPAGFASIDSEISWRKTDIVPGLPMGYTLRFGTQYPPTDIIADVGLNTTYFHPNKVPQQTYYWSIIPYGQNGVEAFGCPVWSFTVEPDINITIPYFEDFESGDGDWTATGTVNSWAFGTPEKPVINRASSGHFAWMTGGLDGEYPPSEQSALQSPNILVPPGSRQLYLEVDYWVETEEFWDGANVHYSLNGVTWTGLGSMTSGGVNWYTESSISARPGQYGPGWSGDIESETGTGQWYTAAHLLPTTINNAPSFHLKFAFASDGSFQDDGFAIDNVRISELPATPGCASPVYPVPGENTVPTFPVDLIWSLSSVTDQIGVTGFYLSLGTDNPPTNIYNRVDVGNEVAMVTPASDPGVYYWSVIPYSATGPATGPCPVWSYTTFAYPTITTYPYFEDFENGEGGWRPFGTLSTWALGNPNKTVIRGAGSGNNAWVTGGLGTGRYNNNENSFIISPPFDFRSFTTIPPVISFYIWWQAETSWDGATLQSSIDGGETWQLIGAVGDPTNWYNHESISAEPGGSEIGWSGRTTTTTNRGSNGWVLARHSLTGLQGQPEVLLRFAFATDGSVFDDGFGFDAVRIEPAPENLIPVCATPIYPQPSSSQSIFPFDLRWRYDSNVTGMPLGYILNFGTNNPPNNILSEVDRYLNTSQNTGLKTTGTYYWQVIPYGYNGNRATCPVWSFTTSIPQPLNLPFNENFEIRSGGWLALGDRSSWAFGTPQKRTITGTTSGVNAWVTGNLTGSYNAFENSYLQFPLLNFSDATVDPVISFSMWVSCEDGVDGAVLQSSTDLGIQWTTVGAFGDPGNWYNRPVSSQPGGFTHGWSGQRTSWQTATHALTGLRGQQRVLLRFAFSSDGFVQGDGFAVDDVSIVYPSATTGFVVTTGATTGRVVVTTGTTGFVVTTGDSTPPTTTQTSTSSQTSEVRTTGSHYVVTTGAVAASSESSNGPVIAAVVIIVVVLLLIAGVLGLIYWRRYVRNKYKAKEEPGKDNIELQY